MKKAVCVLLRNPQGQFLCVSRKDDHSWVNFAAAKGKIGMVIFARHAQELTLWVSEQHTNGFLHERGG